MEHMEQFHVSKSVKDAGDLLILRETLLEQLGPAYMWLICLSVVDWFSLSDEEKQQNAQMRLDWLASYSKASEAVLQHWFWKLLKKKTENFAPLQVRSVLRKRVVYLDSMSLCPASTKRAGYCEW